MQLHHQKHHAAYVNNYNAAEQKLQEAITKGHHVNTNFHFLKNLFTVLFMFLCYLYEYLLNCKSTYYFAGDTKTIIELGPALKFNGGGHVNHCIFWEVLSPSSSAGKPSGKLCFLVSIVQLTFLSPPGYII